MDKIMRRIVTVAAHKQVQEGASNEWLEAVTNEVYDKL